MLTKKIEVGDLCIYTHRGRYKNVTAEEILSNNHNEVMLTVKKSKIDFFNQKFINFTCLSASGKVITIPNSNLVKVTKFKIE